MIDRLGEIISSLESFKDSLDENIKESLVDSKEDMLDEQREQLLEGKDSEGKDMRPYYSEDLKSKGGWFHSPESARNYIEFKASLSYPNGSGAERNPDAPNLFINGAFHQSLDIVFDDTFMVFTGANSYANGIIAKYGLDKFGLEDWRMAYFLEEKVVPSLQEKIKELL